MRYRRRPPWWPENEPFPPTRRWGRGYGPPPFVRWIGCFVLTLFGVSLLAGGLAIGSREHGEPTVLEIVADELHDPRLVVHHQDGRHGDHPRFRHRP